MTDDLRWAVRYAFLEDLWRDQPRVVVDAGLEAVLREGSRARGGEGPLDGLVDALIPRVSRARTWMAVADEAVARELAQTRPGTGFLPRGSFADVVAHRDWAVALVELPALHDDAPGGARLREVLAERAQEGRTVIVSARSAPGQEDEDAGFAALSELLDGELGGGRIFGVYRPPMAAVIDFGGEGEGEDEDGEVPLSFDNTLGSQSPAFVEYVAIAGSIPELPEGMTLVELPADAPTIEQSSDGALRAQLVQAQRQAELAAIDRQTLLEKVDALESAQARLEQQATELRDHLTRAVTEEAPQAAEAAQRLQAALADNQALRWKAQQLERELEATKARPVETLEGEVASLRAELASLRGEARGREETDAGVGDVGDVTDVGADGAGGRASEGEGAGEGEGTDAYASEGEGDGDGDGAEEIASDADDGADAYAGDVEDAGEGEGAEAYGEAEEAVRAGERGELLVLASEAEDAALRIRYRGALAELDRLIQRLERGGMGTLQVRQALILVRRRLQA